MARSLLASRRVLVTGVLVAVGLVGAGFGAAQVVRSPQQLAAEAAGPGPTTLTVPVEHRALSAKVVVRGDVAAGRQYEVSGPAGEGSTVVTRVRVKPGGPVKAGRVLVEVAGRPVFALPGSLPAYRDLRPGYEGDDVEQLQRALTRLGFDPGKRDGVFGAGTKEAVKQLYDSLGYPVPQAGENDDQLVSDAAKAVQDAEQAVRDAESAREKARSGGAERALQRARRDAQAAKNEHARIVAETGPMVPLGEYFFLPVFPARVADLKAEVGLQAPSPLLTVAAGELRAVGTISVGQAELIAEGQSVDVMSESNGITTQGKVTSIKPVSREGTTSFELVVKPTENWPAELSGSNVRLTVNGASTEGKKLVVPVSALFATADGATNVTVREGGRDRDVPVTVDVHAGGYAAVKPVRGELAAGDLVVISAENATAWSDP